MHGAKIAHSPFNAEENKDILFGFEKLRRFVQTIHLTTIDDEQASTRKMLRM
jgi:hypothetical protein